MGEISKIEEIELSHVLMCSMRSARTQRAPISEYGPYNSAVTEMEAAGYSMRKKEGKKGGPPLTAALCIFWQLTPPS